MSIINWNPLYKKQKLSNINFNPEKEEKKEIIELLKTPRTKIKKNFKINAGKEFMKIYELYRREICKTKYIPCTTDKKKAIYVSEFCFLYEVTPFELIKFHHYHCQNFKGLKFVPLRMLATTYAFNEIKCYDLNKYFRNIDKIETKKEKAKKNSFNDPEKYDKKIRKVLISSGFDITNMNDDELYSVQLAALQKQKGYDLFISRKNEILSDWLLKNYYKK